MPVDDAPLRDRVALITGGTSGIGAATVRVFAQAGASVVFTGRRVELGARLAAELNTSGLPVRYYRADHTRLEDCQGAVDFTLAEFGRLDILFNNAGMVPSGTAESTSEAVWAETLALNVTAVWRMSRLVLPHLRAQRAGVIISNASDWGLVGGKDALAYCTSKGAVVQMTRAMALDHAAEGIRVNAVCPGDTYVERWSEVGYYVGSGPVMEADAQAESGAHLPLGRVARVEEIAQVVLFLASDAASYITGVALPVDGGNTAR